MVEEQIRKKFRYECDVDVGDMRCEYSTEAEDMAAVRAEAAQHRVAEHRIEDIDPMALDALIDAERHAPA